MGVETLNRGLLNQAEKYNITFIPELNGLRGIAIIFVMLMHTGIPLFKGGHIGVDIFFVLSGFLITSIIISEYNSFSRISLKNFYIRRIFRLAPALMILLTTVTLISQISSFSDEKVNFMSVVIAALYSANWVRAFNLHNMGILSHTWSLSIEEQFYIIWPLLLYILLKILPRKRILIFVVSIAVSAWLLRISG